MLSGFFKSSTDNTTLTRSNTQNQAIKQCYICPHAGGRGGVKSIPEALVLLQEINYKKENLKKQQKFMFQDLKEIGISSSLQAREMEKKHFTGFSGRSHNKFTKNIGHLEPKPLVIQLVTTTIFLSQNPQMLPTCHQKAQDLNSQTRLIIE